jgi:hypothetical protein
VSATDGITDAANNASHSFLGTSSMSAELADEASNFWNNREQFYRESVPPDSSQHAHEAASSRLLPLPPTYQQRYKADKLGSAESTSLPVFGDTARQYGLGFSSELEPNVTHATKFVRASEPAASS